MGTKVAEIFATIDLDASKIGSQAAEVRNIFTRTSSDVQKKLEEMKRRVENSYNLAEYQIAARNPNISAADRFKEIRTRELIAAFQRQKAAEQAMNQASGGMAASGMNKYQFAITQAGFGVQDFIQQIGPMGLGGALSASANNWAMVATTLSTGTVGALAGIGITLAAVMPSLIHYFSQTNSGAEEAKARVEALTHAYEAQQRVLESLRGIREAGDVTSIKDRKAAETEVESKANEAARIRETQADIKRQMDETEKKKRLRVVTEVPIDRATRETFERALSGTGSEEDVASARSFMRMFGEKRGGQVTSIKDGKAVVTRAATEEERTEADKRLVDLRKQLEDSGAKLIEIEERIAAAKKKGVKLTEDELADIKRIVELTESFLSKRSGGKESTGFTFNDPENARKAAEIAAEYEKKNAEVRKQERAGVISGSQADSLIEEQSRESRRKIADIQESEADKEFADADRKNQEYSRKKAEREKEVTKMTHDLERDNLGKRAKEQYDIRRRLEERRDEILTKVKDPKEAKKLLDMAADAAEREKAALKPIGGDKTSITGFADTIQKALFGGDMSKNMAQTAKNTKDQSNKLDTLITAVRNINTGATAQ